MVKEFPNLCIFFYTNYFLFLYDVELQKFYCLQHLYKYYDYRLLYIIRISLLLDVL